MTTTVKKPIDVPPRHPRPRAITTGEAVLNDRFVEKRWGDLKQGYQIVDRLGMRVLRDPFTAKPFVLWLFAERGG